ncbi:hypothetical protein Lesp02_84020 [Lentzea sp. NBRC 105346]|uniref:hypothetical protein n=1 Tax=Lentzea sp. NBRC 105346 TaxID=3032205 RepID=UPI0024A3A230|nr:hypothetical protein [Lentzea sp. NBRC 105346]GLZ36215.1 hypothetical protein Lesp02_84020 [Lentzea sp. NBRC 105346]
MDVVAVFEGLAEAASSIEGLRCSAFMPDSISPPVFYPVELEIDFDLSYGRGHDDFNPVVCRVLVPRSDDRSGQKLLQQYMKGAGPLSVKRALEADRTLGGACSSLHVAKVRGMGQYEHGVYDYIGADWLVRVIGRGD